MNKKQPAPGWPIDKKQPEDGDEHELIYHDMLNARVCSTGTWDEALEWVRRRYPAGTSHNWQKKTEPEAALPIQCDDDPEKTHYMFIC